MSYDNRLSAEQIAALEPGDTVTIETWRFHTPDFDVATVSRLTATQVVVTRSAHRDGGTYEDRFRRKDGLRIGAGQRSELIDPAHPRSVTAMALASRKRRQLSIDSLARGWSRNRDDLDALRELHTAIGEYLDAEAEQ